MGIIMRVNLKIICDMVKENMWKQMVKYKKEPLKIINSKSDHNIEFIITIKKIYAKYIRHKIINIITRLY